jgi:uncharacterized membrane protein YphA (DoxX/SURF4 family)
MANPVYLLFASRAGAAGAVLRWTIAGLILFAGISRFTLMESNGFIFPWLDGGFLPEGMLGGIALILVGFLLLVGFFTRLCTLLLLILMATSFGTVDFGQSGAGQPTEWILSASICLTLTICGAGSMSLDRKISNFFLPTLS